MMKFEKTNALSTWLIACLLVLLAVVAHAKEFQVGDDRGWTVPSQNSDFYKDWSEKQTLVVNDILHFKYSEGQHNVLVVSESDYNRCFNQTPIEIHTDGDTSIRLNRTGSWYFLCGYPQHCIIGQKFSAEVRNASLTGSANEGHAELPACSSVILAALGLLWFSISFIIY